MPGCIGCERDATAPLTVTRTGASRVTPQGSEGGTVIVSCVDVAPVTVAGTPSTVTELMAGVVLKFDPVIVAVAPGNSSAGAIDVSVIEPAFAVNVTDGRDPAVATSVLGPAVGPSIQLPTRASPAALDVAVPPVTDPPVLGVNVTTISGTGLPNWSLTMTTGATGTAAPGSADWSSPPDFVRLAAAPGPAVAVNVTGESEPVLAVNVWVPLVVPSVQDPALAAPDEFDTAVAVDTDPPPLVTEKTTVTPATGFPAWLRTTTDGASATAWPTVPVSVVDEVEVMLAATDVTGGGGGVGPSPPPPPQEPSSAAAKAEAHRL